MDMISRAESEGSGGTSYTLHKLTNIIVEFDSIVPWRRAHFEYLTAENQGLRSRSGLFGIKVVTCDRSSIVWTSFDRLHPEQIPVGGELVD